MGSRDWSQQEVEAAVRDYLRMLASELRGEPYNKAAHNRRLRIRLNDRSKGAVERKHQNISAVLISLGFPYIKGYKPLGNVQAMLRNAVQRGVPPLEDLVAREVTRPQEPVAVDDVLGICVPAPQPAALATAEERAEYDVSDHAQNVDYLLREALNRSLGDAGEALILKYERARLRRQGKDDLARNVEQVSKTIGDGAGYDIRSYEVTGQDRFVEVKTTRYGQLTPFYISAPELRFSRAKSRFYQLYRVFDYSRQPKLFTLPGDVARHVRLEVTNYRAWF